MTRNNQPDLYAILGVDPHASREQIAHAYRTLVRRYHPDTRPSTPPDDHGHDYAVHDSQDQTRLQQVLAAYAVLHDPASRADYDRVRRPAPVQQTQVQPAPRSRPVPADPPVIIGTVTHRRRSTPAWIATIDNPITALPTHPTWDWIRAFDM